MEIPVTVGRKSAVAVSSKCLIALRPKFTEIARLGIFKSWLLSFLGSSGPSFPKASERVTESGVSLKGMGNESINGVHPRNVSLSLSQSWRTSELERPSRDGEIDVIGWKDDRIIG